jgi:hypothetical protein
VTFDHLLDVAVAVSALLLLLAFIAAIVDHGRDE